MCDGIKNVELLRKQLRTAIDNDIEIIEIEFISGKVRHRDRWSVQEILGNVEKAEAKYRTATEIRDNLNKSGV